MSEEKSTTVATTEKGNGQAVDLASLNSVNNFLEDVLQVLAPGEKTERKEVDNAEKESNSQKEKQEVLEEKTEETSETPEETTQEEVAEEEPITPESTDKRVRDAQSMIGRQSNEIGQLRKQNTELMSKMNELANTFATKAEQQPTNEIPYYEKLLKASDEDVAKILEPVLGSEYSNLDPKAQARMLQLIVKTTQDIVADRMKPFQQSLEMNEQQARVAQMDQQWKEAHPEHEARKQLMQAEIRRAYPDGLQDAQGKYIADPYQVAHMAYAAAGAKLESAKGKVEAENNKRIVAGRSSEHGTRSVTGTTKAQPKPVDPIKAEVNRVWETNVSRYMAGR